MLSDKPFESITEDDLRQLVENQVPEGRTMEYKQALRLRPQGLRGFSGRAQKSTPNGFTCNFADRQGLAGLRKDNVRRFEERVLTADAHASSVVGFGTALSR